MIKNLVITILFLLAKTLVYGQTKVGKSEILDKKQIAKIFTDTLKKQFNFIYPISKVYKCLDNTGQFYIVLTESIDVNKDNDIHHHLRAYNIRQVKNAFSENWIIKDFIIMQGTDDDIEHSIWFWTKYCEFVDINNDGVIDPILVYGSSGSNYTSDGRIKILIFYKGQKIAIRHQNGVLDSERNTKVDKAFYALPVAVQNRTKSLMTKMNNENNAIFPHGWETAMKNRKEYFDEN